MITLTTIANEDFRFKRIFYMTKERLKISSPWVTYVNKLKALFEDDPEITIKYDNEVPKVTFYVNNSVKAEILGNLLPVEKWFGNVCLEVNVVPANKDTIDMGTVSNKEMFDILFDRNPAYSFSVSIDGILSNSITYVVFAHKVVQFFNDNLNDAYGNISTLYQEIASDIFEDADLRGVYYCTDIDKENGMSVGMPLGEWP